TDSRGLAVLPHAQETLVMPGPDVVAWWMVLRCDAGTAVERQVTGDELLAGKPIVLTVPVGGAVAVDVVGADGKWSWSRVRLEDATTGEMRADDRDDGASWFRQLPLGRQWVASAAAYGEDVRRALAGPIRADEVVRVRIDLPLRRLYVHGRVVRADGVPVP